SAKNPSCAVTTFRRSDFIEATYAFALVLANFGIAMAAKMPMITTTIRSSISVKPLRFIVTLTPVRVAANKLHACMKPTYPTVGKANPVPDAARLHLSNYEIIRYDGENPSRGQTEGARGRRVLQGARPTAMPVTRECHPKAAITSPHRPAAWRVRAGSR